MFLNRLILPCRATCVSFRLLRQATAPYQALSANSNVKTNLVLSKFASSSTGAQSNNPSTKDKKSTTSPASPGGTKQQSPTTPNKTDPKSASTKSPKPGYADDLSRVAGDQAKKDMDKKQGKPTQQDHADATSPGSKRKPG